MLIMLKEPKKSKIFNEILKDKGLENFFLEKENLIDWLEDINTNPESPQKHLKPAGKKLTMKELKQIFKGSWTTVGMLDVDLYFGRTSVCDMQKLASFIVRFAHDIEYVKGSDVLIERGELTHLSTEEIWTIKGLEKEDEELIPYSDEEKEKQNELQSGHLLCKGFGDSRFWTAFGKVESPKFIQKLEWKNGHNGLYKNNEGHAFMLLPLYDFSPNFFTKVYERAAEIGMMEHPTFFIAYHYPVTFDEKMTAQNFSDFYTKDELRDRFNILLKEAKATKLRDDKILKIKKVKGTLMIEFIDRILIRSEKKVLLRALFLAMQLKEGENFKEWYAEEMIKGV